MQLLVRLGVDARGSDIALILLRIDRALANAALRGATLLRGGGREGGEGEEEDGGELHCYMEKPSDVDVFWFRYLLDADEVQTVGWAHRGGLYRSPTLSCIAKEGS